MIKHIFICALIIDGSIDGRKVIMTRNIEVPEILAPVGSIEAFYSAIHNGCDALYLGGHNFGARAYANNFGEEELKALVEYAHLFNVQVYYTLNTLVKDIELKTLHQELELMRSVAIDAVIIQDLGVYNYIKNHFSDLVIHGSTQMNLHSVKDVEVVKALGFDRVVLSRECSLEDIRKVKEATGIEIEAFVHGALCYCYSGQCLMSSMYGGRSGNRGKCAQPCRLVYEVDNEAGYYLSPKDQMTLEILPDLIKAGVDSFKIEGRMKSAEYVGYATRIYKKYRNLSIDLIKKGEEANYKVNPKDIVKLNQLFNRGHFTQGYYKQHNDKEMISYTHGKNQGWPVGTLSIINNQFVFNLNNSITKDDLLEIHSDINLKNQEIWPAFSFNDDMRPGKTMLSILYDSKGQKLNPKQFSGNKTNEVYRIRDKKLLEELSIIAENKVQIPLFIQIIGHVNMPLQFNVYEKGNDTLLVTLTGNIVERALKRATGEADFIKQMGKTKDTAFIVEDIDFNIGDDIFVPIGSINELRREMIELVTNKRLEAYVEEKHLKNNTLEQNKQVLSQQMNDKLALYDDKLDESKDNKSLDRYTISIRTTHQIEALLGLLKTETNIERQTRRIYIDLTDLNTNEINDALKQFSKFDSITLYLALPHVVFEDYKAHLMTKLNNIDTTLYKGLLVRTLGGLLIAKELKKSFVTDYNLHAFNTPSLDEFYQLGAKSVTLSLELNQQGLGQIIKTHPLICETVIYGSTALMHSANCVYKTRTGRCDKKETGHELELEDRKGINHKVSCHCNMCYNTIFNKHPLLIHEETMNFDGTFRLDFTSEGLMETKAIIKGLYNHLLAFDQDRHTRGHFKKGVK